MSVEHVLDMSVRWAGRALGAGLPPPEAAAVAKFAAAAAEALEQVSGNGGAAAAAAAAETTLRRCVLHGPPTGEMPPMLRHALAGLGEEHAAVAKAAGDVPAAGTLLGSAAPEAEVVPQPAVGRVLSVAGSDSSGGAGIQADLKAVEAAGGFGMTALTALTAQNTQGVQGVLGVDTAFIRQQMDSCADDVGVDCIKTGMLPDAAVVNAVADWLAAFDAARAAKGGRRVPLVVDPVLVSASGCSLAETSAAQALKETLLRRATVCTPNLPEARALLGKENVPMREFCASIADMKEIAEALGEACGSEHVLLKGGHFDEVLDEAPAAATDVLFTKETGAFTLFEGPWVASNNTHGTGCTLASTIAAYLAQGHSVQQSVALAKLYISSTLKRSASFSVGAGNHRPMRHSPYA